MNDLLVDGHVANLRHSEPRVRYEAVAALAAIGNVSVVPALMKELQAHTVYYDPTNVPDDREMPWRLVHALGVLGDPAAVPVLAEALTDGNQEVRVYAIAALGRIGDLSAAPALIEALVRGGAHINWEAANSAYKPDGVSAVPPLVVDWGRTRNLQHSRFAIVSALGQIGHPAAIAALAEALRSNDPVVRSLASTILMQIRKAALPQLLHMLRDDTRSLTDDFMAMVGHLGAPALPDLIAAIWDESPIVRCRSAETLGRIGDASACLALRSVLQDTSLRVRWDAALALDHMGDDTGLPVLVTILLDAESRPEVFSERLQTEPGSGRRRAAQLGYVLSKVGVVAVPALLDALREPDDKVRIVAAEQLQKLGDSETLPRKIIAERRLSIQERIDLLDRLREVRGFDAWYQFPNTPALCRKVMMEPNPEMREEAQAILNWLTLLRGSEGASVVASTEFVRPILEEGVPVEPATMLRASDHLQTDTEISASTRTLWQRLFRR